MERLGAAGIQKPAQERKFEGTGEMPDRSGPLSPSSSRYELGVRSNVERLEKSIHFALVRWLFAARSSGAELLATESTGNGGQTQPSRAGPALSLSQWREPPKRQDFSLLARFCKNVANNCDDHVAPIHETEYKIACAYTPILLSTTLRLASSEGGTCKPSL